jgi:N-acetylmuramoyl-L-alanine amidase
MEENKNSRWAFRAGHSDKDPGASALTGPCEHERCKKVIDYCEALWYSTTPKELGPLFVPRASDHFVYPKYLTSAIQEINHAGVSAAMELHGNKNKNNKCTGAEVYYCSAAGKEMAGFFREELLKWRPNVPCTIIHDSLSYVGHLGFLHDTQMPAILIEWGYLSNSDDISYFDAHWRDLAEALVRGAVAYGKFKGWDKP